MEAEIRDGAKHDALSNPAVRGWLFPRARANVKHEPEPEHKRAKTGAPDLDAILAAHKHGKRRPEFNPRAGVCLVRNAAGGGGTFQSALCLEDGHAVSSPGGGAGGVTRCSNCSKVKENILAKMLQHAEGDAKAPSKFTPYAAQARSGPDAALRAARSVAENLRKEKRRRRNLLIQLNQRKKACSDDKVPSGVCKDSVHAVNEALAELGIDKALPPGSDERVFFDAELKNLASAATHGSNKGARCNPALCDCA